MNIFNFTAALFLLMLSSPLLAHAAGQSGEITQAPICSYLINRSSVTIHGSIDTAEQTLPDGTKARHTNNFKLSPNEETQICASGPFYEGRRVDLTIRTLFPLFACRTKIDQDIFLDMKELPGGTKEYSATCR